LNIQPECVIDNAVPKAWPGYNLPN